MPKIRALSGRKLIRIFESLGFSIVGQKGSHVKIRRVIDNNRQTLTVPDHKDLDKGTLKAIYNQALRYISESELKPRAFSLIIDTADMCNMLIYQVYMSIHRIHSHSKCSKTIFCGIGNRVKRVAKG